MTTLQDLARPGIGSASTRLSLDTLPRFGPETLIFASDPLTGFFGLDLGAVFDPQVEPLIDPDLAILLQCYAISLLSYASPSPRFSNRSCPPSRPLPIAGSATSGLVAHPRLVIDTQVSGEGERKLSLSEARGEALQWQADAERRRAEIIRAEAEFAAYLAEDWED